MTPREKVLEALNFIQAKTRLEPQIGVILGSGLGDLADTVESATSLPFSTIPHFPVSTVAGHAGALVLGMLRGRTVAVMRGRVHYYEGYSMEQVTFPTRLLHELGCSTLVVTNASGGIRTDLKAGDFCQITDHVNLMGENPLRGHNEEAWGVRFPDMSTAYHRELGALAQRVAQQQGIPLKQGVFCAVSGPSYETRAEIRMMANVGADLVGMSTVPEVIVANHMGMKVLGISCVTNAVHGNAPAATHEEVLQVAQESRPRFLQLMQALVEALPAAVAHQRMRAVDIIRHKRDGDPLTAEELTWFCRHAGQSELPDYQVSAFLMACWLKGMSAQETTWLTDAMLHSGDTVDLSDVPGIKVDKHSTGGVGDTTTLIVAPLAAACGLMVAKMSGRGLGHTGGTLDKLEAIPGLTTSVSLSDFKAQVRRLGLAVVGQTGTLVPADSKFYSIRDVTATIDSVPLIASSVMSKKLAAGADVIVLDVKCGRGAFMQTVPEARELARLMVDIGTRLGRRVRAVITRMESPLGLCIGNAIEVREALEILQGQHLDSALCDVSLTLCAHLMVMAGIASSMETARSMAMEKLRRGDALYKLRQMIEAQGGQGRVVEDFSLLPTAHRKVPVPAPRGGYVQALDALDVGEAAALLGAGRSRKEDAVDPAVGVVLLRQPGDLVEAGEPLAELHVNDPSQQAAAAQRVLQAYRLGPEAPSLEPLVIDTVQ